MSELALLLLLVAAQDKASPCDSVRMEEGLYCPKCEKVLRRTDKMSDVEKDDTCKNCKSQPEKVRVCVKEWVPVCGMHGQRAHERCCCKSSMCCKIEQVHALMLIACACGASARSEEALKHKVDAAHAHSWVCSRSGTAPHGAACDLKTIESGSYCRDCGKLLEKGDADKEGRCLQCKKKPDTVKVCVKTHKGEAFRARVAFSCTWCRSEGDEGGACAKKDCPRNGKPFEAVCTDGGSWPHGGTPPREDK